VNLPEAVRQQLAQGEAEIAEMYSDAQVLNAPQPGDEAVVVHAPENVESDVVQQLIEQTRTPAPEAQPVTQQPPEAQAPTPANDPWEQKYKVLQGKYNSEIPRLNQQLTQAMTANETLSQRLADLEARLNEREADAKSAITPEEESAYGKDLIDLTRRIAQAEAAKASRKAEEEAKAARAQLDAVTQQSAAQAQERFMAALASRVPDWEQVNVSEGWLNWLGQRDALLRKTRQEALDEAAAVRDADAVVALFDAYKVTLPKVAAPATSMQQQVVPRSTTAAPMQQGVQKRIYSEADISTLFAAKRRGEFTPQQWATISAEIDSAVVEGRVR